MRYYFRLLFVSLCVYFSRAQECNFPGFATDKSRQPWVWKLRSGKEGHGSYHVRFHGGVMQSEVYSFSPESQDKSFYWSCVLGVGTNIYLVAREEVGTQTTYLCAEFVQRSPSVLQLRMSKLSVEPDPGLCYSTRLRLNPWLLVSFQNLDREHKVCSFAGGFNMKIWAQDGNANGCNLMNLPMRLESECLGGEGIVFDFRYMSCVSSLPMDVNQRTLCIADWSDEYYHYSVVQKYNKKNLWCLRVAKEHHHRTHKAEVFLDLVAPDVYLDVNHTFSHVALELHKEKYDSLCADEYAQCSEESCSSSSRHHCPKSCGACDPYATTEFCSFSKAVRGRWIQRDFDSQKTMHVTRSHVTLESVGKFECLMSSRHDKHTRKYALLSLYSNGCRPRYTCMLIKEIDTSVLGYSMSKTFIWPFDENHSLKHVCNNDNFSPELPPLRDVYRSNVDSPKAVVSLTSVQTKSHCSIDSAYMFDGKFSDYGTCSGTYYTDCDDNRKLRFEYSTCSDQVSNEDFYCLAKYSGKYWETIIIIQNMRDPTDTRCLLTSFVHKGKLLMLPASQCDKMSWVYVNSGLRRPLAEIDYQEASFLCKHVPTPRPTSSTTSTIKTTSTTTTSTRTTPFSNPNQADAPKSKPNRQPSRDTLSKGGKLSPPDAGYHVDSPSKQTENRDVSYRDPGESMSEEGKINDNSLARCLRVSYWTWLYITLVVIGYLAPS